MMPAVRFFPQGFNAAVHGLRTYFLKFPSFFIFIFLFGCGLFKWDGRSVRLGLTFGVVWQYLEKVLHSEKVGGKNEQDNNRILHNTEYIYTRSKTTVSPIQR